MDLPSSNISNENKQRGNTNRSLCERILCTSAKISKTVCIVSPPPTKIRRRLNKPIIESNILVEILVKYNQPEVQGSRDSS